MYIFHRMRNFNSLQCIALFHCWYRFGAWQCRNAVDCSSLFDCRFEWRIFHRFAWIVIKPYYRRPATRHSLHSSAHRRQRANARCPRSKIAPGLRPTGNQGLLPLDLKMELIKTIKDLLQIPRLDLAIISLKITLIYLNIVFAITLSDNLGSNRLHYFQD